MTTTAAVSAQAMPDLRPEQLADPVVIQYTAQDWAALRGLFAAAWRALPADVLERCCAAILADDDDEAAAGPSPRR